MNKEDIHFYLIKNIIDLTSNYEFVEIEDVTTNISLRMRHTKKKRNLYLVISRSSVLILYTFDV